jgi:hypothetical protein
MNVIIAASTTAGELHEQEPEPRARPDSRPCPSNSQPRILPRHCEMLWFATRVREPPIPWPPTGDRWMDGVIGFESESPWQAAPQMGDRASADSFRGFDNISTLAGSGWTLVNNSSPAGLTGWFQGNSGVFNSQAGAPDSSWGEKCPWCYHCRRKGGRRSVSSVSAVMLS